MSKRIEKNYFSACAIPFLRKVYFPTVLTKIDSLKGTLTPKNFGSKHFGEILRISAENVLVTIFLVEKNTVKGLLAQLVTYHAKSLGQLSFFIKLEGKVTGGVYDQKYQSSQFPKVVQKIIESNHFHLLIAKRRYLDRTKDIIQVNYIQRFV